MDQRGFVSTPVLSQLLLPLKVLPKHRPWLLLLPLRPPQLLFRLQHRSTALRKNVGGPIYGMLPLSDVLTTWQASHLVRQVVLLVHLVLTRFLEGTPIRFLTVSVLAANLRIYAPIHALHPVSYLTKGKISR